MDQARLGEEDGCEDEGDQESDQEADTEAADAEQLLNQWLGELNNLTGVSVLKIFHYYSAFRHE